MINKYRYVFLATCSLVGLPATVVTAQQRDEAQAADTSESLAEVVI